MEFPKIDKYEVKLFRSIEVYEKYIYLISHYWRIGFLAFTHVWKTFFLYVAHILTYTGLIMRYSTIPIHWIWIKREMKKSDGYKLEDKPLFQVGGHYIYGKPGAGKSTMTYHAMMDYAYYTGKCAYTTEMMEMPRKDISGKEYYYHQLFQPSDFFAEGVQVTGFDSDRFNVIVYEEMLTKYQQRNNKNRSYNDEVLPMIASMGTQRHQGIDLFYFISQLPRNDIALMQMLKWYHEPKIKKAFDYHHWLQTGKIKFYIKGWYINSYTVSPKGGNDYELKLYEHWFYENIHKEDMQYFNRLNMKDKYAKLKKMKGVPMNA
jgi:hypothetical protein